MEPLTEIEAPISKVTSEKIVLDLGDRKGIISKNDIALDVRDKDTARFRVGDTVRAVVISEKEGFVKLSIREMYKQRRDAEIAENERVKAAEIAATNPINAGQARKQRVSKERANFASTVAAWLQREKQKKWAVRRAYIGRFLTRCAASIAVMVSAFLLLKPTTPEQIEVDPVIRFTEYLKEIGAYREDSGDPEMARTAELFRADGANFIFASKDAEDKVMPFIPAKTVVLFVDDTAEKPSEKPTKELSDDMKGGN